MVLLGLSESTTQPSSGTTLMQMALGSPQTIVCKSRLTGLSSFCYLLLTATWFKLDQCFGYCSGRWESNVCKSPNVPPWQAGASDLELEVASCLGP